MSKVLNSCNLTLVPATIVEIDIGALVGSASAWHAIHESDSKMTSCHYKKMLLRPRFKNAAIGPKNAA